MEAIKIFLGLIVIGGVKLFNFIFDFIIGSVDQNVTAVTIIVTLIAFAVGHCVDEVNC